VIWWVSPLPWLVPGVVLALVVSSLASARAARWLGVRRPVAWVLLLSTGVILAGTMTPLVAADRPELGLVQSCDLSRIGLAPIDQLRWPSDTTGNIVGLIPLGFAIALVPRSRRKAAVLAAAVALPFLIEGTQFLVAPLNRACQSADVVDNLTGLVIGLVAGAVVAWFAGRRATAS
jgi:glycopeptide antibiotics resistance protein